MVLPSCRSAPVVDLSPHQRPTGRQPPGQDTPQTGHADAGSPAPPMWRLASPVATSRKVRGCWELKSRPTEPPWNPQALGGTLAGRPGFEPADSVQRSPSQLPAATAPRGHSAQRADARACWEGGLPWRGPAGSCRTPNPKTLLGSRPPRPPAPCTRAPVGPRGPVRAKGAEGSKLPFQRETFQAGN